MPDIYRIKRGLDIPVIGIAGTVVRKKADGPVAVCPDNFKGLAPRLLVKEGDKVLAGSPVPLPPAVLWGTVLTEGLEVGSLLPPHSHSTALLACTHPHIFVKQTPTRFQALIRHQGCSCKGDTAS